MEKKDKFGDGVSNEVALNKEKTKLIIMDEGLIKDRYELILKEFQTILTVGYLLLISMGMIFNFFKYWLFGINIFEHAGIFDFLIAPFQDVRIIAFTLLPILFASAIRWVDAWWEKKFPKSYSWTTFGMNKLSWYSKLRTISFLMVALAYVFVGVIKYGGDKKKSIKQSKGISIEYMDGEIRKGKVIGKTQSVLFLLQGDDVKVIPLNDGIREIRIGKVPKRNVGSDSKK